MCEAWAHAHGFIVFSLRKRLARFFDRGANANVRRARHALPAIASSMSWSVGRLFLASSAVAAITWPDGSSPHCGTSSFSHAA
jgi:hypothetical protein